MFYSSEGRAEEDSDDWREAARPRIAGEWLKDAGSLALIVAIFASLLNEVVELQQRQDRLNGFRKSTA